MSAKRAKNMKNWAAARRKSRRIDAARAAAGPSPNVPLGQPNTLINCVSRNNGGAGVKIGPGAHVRSIGGTYRDNGGPNVDNQGRFDSTNDQIGG